MRYSYLPNPYAANDKYTIFNQAAFNPSLGNAPCKRLVLLCWFTGESLPSRNGGAARSQQSSAEQL